MDLNEKKTLKKSLEDIEKHAKNLLSSEKIIKTYERELRRALNSIEPRMISSLLRSFEQASTIHQLALQQLADIATLSMIEFNDTIKRLADEINKGMEAMIPPVQELVEKINSSRSSVFDGDTLFAIKGIKDIPVNSNATQRATDAYIEALEKAIQERDEKIEELLKILEELKKRPKTEFVV